MKKIIFISGATASGKSSFVHSLIDNYFPKATIISADSMQVYKYMDIGSAKPSYDERLKYHYEMIDIVEPFINFNVKDYLDCFAKVLNSTKDIPIFVVGGTGFYIDSIKYGIFDDSSENKDDILKIRNELYRRIDIYGLDSLFYELLEVDEECANSIDRYNSRRVVRALEVYYATGRKFSELKKERKRAIDIEYRSYLIDIDREELYNNINSRVDIMFDNGLLDEVYRLIDMKVNISSTSMQAIGYKECYDYIVNKFMSYDELKDLIKKRTRNFAKRQLTWFRRSDEYIKIKPTKEYLDIVSKDIEFYYNNV